MSKKFMGLLIIFLAVILTIGTVSASKMVNNDFEGYFSMDVPKDVTFQKETNSSDENGFNMDSLTYMSEELAILYFDSPAFSENSSEFLYQNTFQSSYPDLSKCYETQEGNLTILEPETIDGSHFPLVGVSSGNKLVIITGKDLDLIKQMGESIEFN